MWLFKFFFFFLVFTLRRSLFAFDNISINVSQDIVRTSRDSLIFNRDESIASISQRDEASRMFQQINNQMSSSSIDLCRILLIYLSVHLSWRINLSSFFFHDNFCWWWCFRATSMLRLFRAWVLIISRTKRVDVNKKISLTMNDANWNRQRLCFRFACAMFISA